MYTPGLPQHDTCRGARVRIEEDADPVAPPDRWNGRRIRLCLDDRVRILPPQRIRRVAQTLTDQLGP